MPYWEIVDSGSWKGIFDFYLFIMCFIGLSKLPLRENQYLYSNFKFEFYNFAENVAIRIYW